MTDRGEFVRGFFRRLEHAGVPAVALHGWQDGFSGELSDVDLAVTGTAFSAILNEIHRYAAASGWSLAQVFRHEDTAIYAICVCNAEPEATVALDVCSDYQRDGLILLRAEDLLRDRVGLEWGGFRMPAAMELKYRFAKAMAKRKPAAAVRLEIARHKPSAAAELARWLNTDWQVAAPDFSTTEGTAAAMDAMEYTAAGRRPHFRPRSWARWLRRLREPSGLLVELERDQWEREAKDLATKLGRLYFRNGLAVQWSWRLFMMLARSTVVMIPGKAPRWSRWFCRDVFYQGAATEDGIAAFLTVRCRKREEF